MNCRFVENMLLLYKRYYIILYNMWVEWRLQKKKVIYPEWEGTAPSNNYQKYPIIIDRHPSSCLLTLVSITVLEFIKK